MQEITICIWRCSSCCSSAYCYFLSYIYPALICFCTDCKIFLCWHSYCTASHYFAGTVFYFHKEFSVSGASCCPCVAWFLNKLWCKSWPAVCILIMQEITICIWRCSSCCSSAYCYFLSYIYPALICFCTDCKIFLCWHSYCTASHYFAGTVFYFHKEFSVSGASCCPCVAWFLNKLWCKSWPAVCILIMQEITICIWRCSSCCCSAYCYFLSYIYLVFICTYTDT